MSPLQPLIDDGIIDAIRGRLKSGKEADVYLVERDGLVLVAKVYKDRAHRSFKNNAVYKEGRKTRNSRTQRAIDSKSKYGRDEEEEAWKGAEADALFQLHFAGVRVPEPVIFYEGVLLMQLVKDAEGRPAPRLIDVAYDDATARAHYMDIRGQLVRMLCCHTIHGDLSPYNILAAEAGPTIIDFPQIISAAHSTNSSFFFLRDFDNVMQFLVKADPTLVAHSTDGGQIWRAYSRGELSPEFVPSLPRRKRGRSASPARGRKDRGGKQRAPQRRERQVEQPPRSKPAPATSRAAPKARATTPAPTPRRRRRRRRRR